MSKKKLVISFDNLPPGVMSQVEKQYPDGWINHVFKVQGPKDMHFYAILVVTEEVDYLVKVKIKKDKKGVDAEEDFLPDAEDATPARSDSGSYEEEGHTEHHAED